jgi:hypothetical protein
MPYSFGNAFNRFFQLLGGNFVPFAIIGLICTILPAMGLVYFEISYLGIASANPTWINTLSTLPPAIWAFVGIGWLVMFLFNLMSLSAITEVAILRSVNKPVNYGAVIGNALRNAIPLFAVEFLVGLLVLFGFVLLIIPGLFWALCTCVSVPAYVGQPGIGITGAMQKSFDLTRNHRWSLLLLFIVMIIIAGVASSAITGATLALPGGRVGLPALLTRGFINGVFALLGHVLTASIYVSLRESKEKTTPESAAAVF